MWKEDDTKFNCHEGKFGDPENPPCSRLTLSGTFKNVTGTPEYETAKAALNVTHPAMTEWGCFEAGGGGDHAFFLAKMEIQQAWLIDIFGGAAIITADDYLGADTLTQGDDECAETDETTCDADAKCTWCQSAAVPSGCKTKADAAKLPSSIFKCD